MKYRDALKISKNCPKCCSDTLERFLKDSGKYQNEPVNGENVSIQPEENKPCSDCSKKKK